VRLSYKMNLKTLVLKTSALPVVVAGVVLLTRLIAYAISVATLARLATGGTLTHKGRGAGE
jgi:hypothetical protein